jgi:hypothetical protein
MVSVTVKSEQLTKVTRGFRCNVPGRGNEGGWLETTTHLGGCATRITMV